MKKLVVLDYEESSVNFYDVADNKEINDEVLEAIGYKMSATHWMLCDKMEIIHHKEPLTSQTMEKYYLLGFPENQEFMENEDCYWIADGMMLAVPCELYDSKHK